MNAGAAEKTRWRIARSWRNALGASHGIIISIARIALSGMARGIARIYVLIGLLRASISTRGVSSALARGCGDILRGNICAAALAA